MWGVLLAPGAVLFQLEALFDLFLVARGLIIHLMAHGAFHFDEIVLGHSD